MYQTKTYQAESSTQALLDYYCSRCDCTFEAEVSGHGRASDTNGGGMFSDGEDMARHKAEYDAARDAVKILRLAPCPKCGQRNSKVVWRFWLTALIWLLVLESPAIVLSFIYVVFGLGVGVVTLISWLVSTRHTWRGSIERVRIVRPVANSGIAV